MRPGMPLGRKHFRRSRDAPITAFPPETRKEPTEKGTFGRPFLSKICIHLSHDCRLSQFIR